MINRLRGEVVQIEAGQLTVMVGGLGLGVHVPAGFEYRLACGQQVDLMTVLITREDALDLYGFAEARQREIFKLLLGVSGVGPKTAMNIVSSIEPGMFLDQVVNENVNYLCTLPGIGKKSAQRIVLELKEKIKRDFDHPGAGAASCTSASEDAVAALVTLGYSEKQAREAVAAVEAPDVEGLIKLALKELIR